MNKRILALVLLCAASAMTRSVPAAVVQRFAVETSAVSPVTIRAYHGETLSLEATVKSYGVTVTNVTTASFLWQTNGMDTAWWQTNATFSAGVARATFAPAMDVGADRVSFFFSLADAAGGSYRPSGTILLMRSPGANPTAATLPEPGGTLDFSTVTVLNAPWCTLEAAQGAVSTGLNTALNAVATLSNSVAATYAKQADIPTVPSLTGYATKTEVETASNAVLSAAASSAAATYQPLAGMSSYALKTDLPTVPSLTGYATETYATNAANAARLAAEQTAAATYQPLAGMSSYALKTDLPTVPSLDNYATKTEVENAVASAVIGAGSADYTLRLLAADGSRFQTADGSVYEVTIAPVATNWQYNFDHSYTLTNAVTNVWTYGSPDTPAAFRKITYSNEVWYLTENMINYTANPAEKAAATNITFHVVPGGGDYADTTYERVVVPAHPVTNKTDQVLYESTGSQGDLIAATNDTLNAAKAYTDASISGTGSVSPQIVTNIATAVSSGKLDATSPNGYGRIYWDGDLLHFTYGFSVGGSPVSFYSKEGVYFGDETLTDLLDAKADVTALSTASNATAQSVATLATQVSTIGAHLNAEDARFVATNYNSATHMPEAYVEIKLTNSTWSTIWREMTRWNKFVGTNWNWQASSWSGFSSWSESLEDELAQKADRAWGYYNSHTGSYAPDGYTWISSPKIAIAADLAYQRTVTSEGAVWVLESNGLVTQTGGETNGYFRISDDEGNTQFEVVKGNKRTVGADATNVTVVADSSPTALRIGYSVQSESHPTIEVCASLTNQSWKAETDADCLANVSWTGSSGAWVATVQAKSVQSSLFVKASYLSGGETYINNAAPVSFSHIYLGGVKYAVSTNTISGHLVLTLTPSN